MHFLYPVVATVAIALAAPTDNNNAKGPPAPAAGPIPYLPPTKPPGEDRYTNPIVNQLDFYLSVEYMLKYSLLPGYKAQDLYSVGAVRIVNETTGGFFASLPAATFHSKTFQPTQNYTLTLVNDAHYPFNVRNETGKIQADLLPLAWSSMATAPIGWHQATELANATVSATEKLATNFQVNNLNLTGDKVRSNWPKNAAWYCFRTFTGEDEFTGTPVAQVFVGSESGIFRINSTSSVY